MNQLIPCSNPRAQFASYQQEILEAIQKVCNSSSYILGPEVLAFENEFAAFHGIKYAVGVGSGTDALALSLRAYDIGSGDEVITVSHTALATVASIVITGATPVLVDVEPFYYTIDPEKIEKMITPKTKAIIPVHIYGQPCDMSVILELAKRYHLRVIEDCAQAHGAEYKGCKVGTMGDAGCFSFYPTKNLGAIGDGGAIISKDKSFIERVKRLRQYGWDDQRASQEPGVVSRLDEIQAAILRIKLKYLEHCNDSRMKIAHHYNVGLVESELVLPLSRQDCSHVYHLYVIQSPKRSMLKEYLINHHVEIGIHYSMPAHLHPGFKNKVILPEDGLPVTEKLSQMILSLPIYPELKAHEIDRIIGAIKANK